MLTHYGNRASWKADDELSLMAVLRAMGLDELRQAKRLIGREIAHREASGPEKHEVTAAEKALFHGRG